jgi:hypothetical protein
MDLIESQYGKLLQKSVYSDNTTLDDLEDFHAKTLDKIYIGCFLDQSLTSKEILKNIQICVEKINRTCIEVESKEEFDLVFFKQMGRDLDLVFCFLFEVFQGVKDSNRGLLGQFLVRFDFNKWFSFGK